MKEKKNIDRLYQESLKNLEVFPPNKSWNAIEKQLATPIATEEKRSKASYWVKISSIAATFLMFLSVSAVYIAPNSNFSKRILNTFTGKKKQEKTTKIVQEKKNIVAEEKQKKEKLEKVQPLEVVKTHEIKNTTTEESVVENKALEEVEINKNFLREGLLSKQQDKNQKSKVVDKIDSKFTVATIFAPVYFNTFESGSSLGNQFKNSSTTSGTSYSYGVKFAYKLNKKFSVQSGVNLINLESNTNDVYVTPGVAVVDLSSLRSVKPISDTKGVASKSIATENATTVSQQFGYIEIPVEVKYNVVDGKVGVNIVGGFSTMLLNKDEVHLKDNNVSQHIGASNNLRPINFSGNLGVDVDYSIKKNLYINVSPMFKVQTNTLSKNSGGVQPYYIGVYTGINYKF